MEKTDKEQKAEIIKLFTEALDRNTTSAHQVWNIIHAMQDACDFMDDKRYKYCTDLPHVIRFIRGKIENSPSVDLALYDDLTDDIQEVIMLSGANAEGLIAINIKSLRDELHEISDIYNS
jgi:hypothetical protein